MRLIVTADDLGLHRGMNEGAVRAHEHGIVTAVSISACGGAVDHAIALVAGCPRLEPGIHLTFVEERPVLPAREVPTLVGRDGRFPGSWRGVAARALTGRIDLDEMEAELRAQIDRLRSSGLTLVHANSHQHLHLLPGVFERVVRVAREAGIGYVRIANDPVPSLAIGPRAWALRALNAAGRRARRELPDSFATACATIGLARAGHLDEAMLTDLLGTVQGTTELVTHPGVGGDSIARDYAWGYDWDRETEALCAAGVARAIAERGITLVGPTQIGSGRASDPEGPRDVEIVDDHD